MELPASICPVPWLNLSIDANGAVRPCCKYQQPDHPAHAMANLRDSNLHDAWNSEGMVQLRTELLKGEKPRECRACWNEEAAGVKSLRQEFTRHRTRSQEVDFRNLRPEAPKTLDLKLSNLCNLKCRICAPSTSSLLLSEVLEHERGTNVDYLRANRNYFQQKKVTAEENLETFKRWLPHLEHVEMFGGEPFVGREVQEIERMMIEAGVAKNISLLYNTNISIFRDDMIERWKNFRKVSISLSLDDLSERLHYERFPSIWERVQDNIAKFRAIQLPNVYVSLVCTVSNYNVWYMPEYVNWVLARWPGLFFMFNFVHDDPEFCITNLPNPIKERITGRINEARRELCESATPESTFASDRLGEIPAFMNGAPPSKDHWRRFLVRTHEFDQRRNQRFEFVFPEYFEALRPYFGEGSDPFRTLDDLTLSLVVAEKQRDDLLANCRRLEAENAKLQADCLDLEERRSGLLSRCESVEANCRELDQKLGAMEQELQICKSFGMSLLRQKNQRTTISRERNAAFSVPSQPPPQRPDSLSE